MRVWLQCVSWQCEWCASSGVMHHPQTARFNWFTVCMCSKTTPAHRLAVMTTSTQYWCLRYVSLIFQYTHTQMGCWTVALCGQVWAHTNPNRDRQSPYTDSPTKTHTNMQRMTIQGQSQSLIQSFVKPSYRTENNIWLLFFVFRLYLKNKYIWARTPGQ